MALEAGQVFYNGTVHTLEQAGAGGQQAPATAIALADNRVLATGDDAAMRSLAAGGARFIDLQGRTVVPGLIDSHNHMLSTGLNAEHVDLSTAKTIGDVLAALGSAATQTGEWVISSSRWHETQLVEARFPSRDELDRAVPATPAAAAARRTQRGREQRRAAARGHRREHEGSTRRHLRSRRDGAAHRPRHRPTGLHAPHAPVAATGR